MSKSFYEKINLLLFVQYESEHVMLIRNFNSGLRRTLSEIPKTGFLTMA